MTYARKTFVLNLSLVFLCASTMILLPLWGQSQRVYSEVPVFRVLQEPKDNLALWRESGVFGRILFLFDRKVHLDYDLENLFLNNEDYIYMGIREDFVRTIYHVIPDRSWQEVQDHLSRNMDASVYGPGFRIAFEGTPLLIMRARDLPSMDEEVLIHINGDAWRKEDWGQIRDLLERGVLKSDFVSLSGSVSDKQVQTLRDVLGIHDS